MSSLTISTSSFLLLLLLLLLLLPLLLLLQEVDHPGDLARALQGQG
jgi:hypothetical protein